MNIGELFIALGFDVEDTKLKAFDDGIRGLTKDFGVVTAATTATLYAFEVFIDTSVRASVALYNFNQQTDLSTTSLQQWQNAAVAANPAMTVNEVTSSIAALENNLVEIRKFGGGNASPFAWLAIDIVHGQTAIDVLEQLRGKVSQIDRATAVNLIQKMGLSPGFINILTKSREEFDKFIAAQVRSKQSIDIIEKLAERMALLQFKLSVFKDNILAEFTPGLIKLIDMFEEFGTTIVQIIKNIDDSLGGHLLASIGLVIAALNPLKTLLIALIGLFEDLNAYRLGNTTGTLTGKIIGGSYKDAVGATTETPFFDSLSDILSNVTSGTYKKKPNNSRYDSLLPPKPTSENITDDFKNYTAGDVKTEIHVTNHINGDGRYIAEQITDQLSEKIQQVDRNAALQDFSKGAGH